MVSSNFKRANRSFTASRWFVLATWIVVSALSTGPVSGDFAASALAEDDASDTVEVMEPSVQDETTEVEHSEDPVIEPTMETESEPTTLEESPAASDEVAVEPVVEEEEITTEAPEDVDTDVAYETVDGNPEGGEAEESTDDESVGETDTNNQDESESTDSETAGDSTNIENEESTPEVTPETSPIVTYLPAQQPTCRLVSNEEIIFSGGDLDYTCDFQAQLDGSDLASTELLLVWRFAVTIAEGWSVQYLPAPTNAEPNPVWTDAQTDVAKFRNETVLSIGDEESLSTIASTAVGVRIHRATCDIGEPSIEIRASIEVEASDEAVEIQQLDVEPLSMRLSPRLAPIPEPSLSFSGSLDFGTIPVDAYGAQQEPEPQILTVTVSGLDQACGDWQLLLQAKNLDDDEGASINATSLSIVSIDGATLSDGECSLDDGCLIATVSAGSNAPAETSYSLGVTLVLPDQPHATTFNSTLTATLAMEEP